MKREFAVGDDVLVQLPVQGNALTATLCGPYKVKQKVDNFNYVALTPDRRKKSQLCHINQLRRYTPCQDLAPRRAPHPDSVTRRLATSTSLPTVQSQNSSRTSNGHAESVLACQTTRHEVTPETCNSVEDFRVVTPPVSLGNSAVSGKPKLKVKPPWSRTISSAEELITEFSDLFPDVPGRARGVYHDIDVGEARPIKQHRTGPAKAEILDREVEYTLANNIIEPSNSPWSSPCHTVPKSDGSVRFITDYRKVNDVKGLTHTHSPE